MEEIGPPRVPVDSIALLEVVRRKEDLGSGLGITLLEAYTVYAWTF